MELGSEFMNAVVAEAPALPGDLTVDVVLVVSTGRGAEEKLSWRVANGYLSVADVPADDALVITVAPKDVEAIVSGELTIPVAYMQGKLKPAGNNALWLKMTKASQGETFAKWRSAVA